MLEIKNLSVTFNKNTSDEKNALDHVSLTLEDGDFISVLGMNGAGKSTLIHAICGITHVSEGNIILDHEDITHISEHKRAANIGTLFQDPLKGTAPSLSIEENLSLAYKHSKFPLFTKCITKQDRQYFRGCLKDLNLGLEDRLKSKVGLLSGGQRQALSLLMATIHPPKLLILDEHTAALDPKTAIQVMELSNHIIKKNKITTIMITHNLKQALSYGNKTIIMKEGKIVKCLQDEERKTMSVEKLITFYDIY